MLKRCDMNCRAVAFSTVCSTVRSVVCIAAFSAVCTTVCSAAIGNSMYSAIIGGRMERYDQS